MAEELGPVEHAIVTIGSLVGVVLSIWMSIVSLVGGTMPIFGWKVEGGFGDWLLWTAIIIPVLMTVLYWILLGVVALIRSAGHGG